MKRLNNSIFQGDPPPLDLSKFWNTPVEYPFKDEEQASPPANRTQLAIDRGYLPEREEGLSNQEYMDALSDNPKEKKPFDFFNFGLGMRRASAGLSWLSGIKERNRQNQYLQNQLSTLGQLDALPAEQPNPYNLYAKYGGKLSKFANGGQEDPKKKQQEKPRKPIIVTDKNDPRLRAYNDSLNLYNYSKLQQQLTKPLTYEKVPINATFEKDNYPRQKRLEDYKKQLLEALNNKVIKKEDYDLMIKNSENLSGVSKSTTDKALQKKGDDIIKNNPNFYWMNDENSPDLFHKKIKPVKSYTASSDKGARNWIFKEPTQPVVYQEEKKLEKPIPIYSKKSLLNFDTNGRPTPDAPPEFQVAQFDNTKPTKYSFSYPTGKYNEQKTIYFPDAGSWKQFIGNQKLINSDEGKDYGSATGYMQMGGFPFNGPIRKMKNVIINNYGNQPMLQSSMDNLTAMIGTENPDFMSMLQGMRSMKKGGLTPNKAREILHDGTAQGHALTDKQRRFFGAKSKGHTNFRGRK